MPRIARLDTPGLLHHIIIRGIERRRIFNDDKDRESFIERLSVLLPKTKTQCYAWALMSNHVHLLIRSGSEGISTLMRRLLTGHAVSYNRLHKRHGPLFQNRYKSIICQEDAYLHEVVRYIHLNPLRAKIVADVTELNQYPYSGHSVLMGQRKREWQNVHYVLGFFGRNSRDARRKYLTYVEEGIAMGRRPELVGGGLIRSLGGWEAVKKMRLSGQDRIKSDQRILGDGDFVEAVLSESEEKFSRKYRLKSQGYDFEKVAEKVASLFKLPKEYITGKGRQQDRVNARDLLCYWSAIELGIPMAELAKKLDMTLAAISYAVKRGEITARENNYTMVK